LENFPKCSLHHVYFRGGLFNGFLSQKINKIKIKLACFAPLCVYLGLKKSEDFTMSEGHRYPLVYLYNILEWSFFPFIRPVIHLVIHPSKFLIPEKEDDGRGGGKRRTNGDSSNLSKHFNN
jgi:hypothetical protein